jgi:predicted membrane-bound spermidine synthase
MTAPYRPTPTGSSDRSVFLFYLAVAFVAGAVIALQIVIMRIFSVGSWAHFGSMVVSLAMMGFGLTSVVMCAANAWFERNWNRVANVALLSFGPLMVVANLLAQQIPFNAIFLISDPVQKWKLFGNFVLYLTPFLAGAFFLGAVFLRMKEVFGRVYFADLVGAGAGGLLLLGCLYLFRPEDLIAVPLALWMIGSIVWFVAQRPAIGNQEPAIGKARATRSLIVLAALGALCLVGHFWLPGALAIPKLAVSDYKGVSYARKFPDSQRVFENASPFGYLEVYSSSYLHFAPGLSDNAAFNLPEIPPNAYLGMYIDGEGPFGVMRKLSDTESAYFKYLPMQYPYVIKTRPETFVVQFGGGISTRVALHNASHVTVAEGNPAILAAFRNDKALRDFSGDILNDPNLSVIDYDGRLYLANTRKRYDVIDLSLADSAGLSSPGGFPIVEKYAYTREAMAAYMRALADGGVLSVTQWNKEEPPKSVLKLYATMVQAAREVEPAADIANNFYAVSSYLSTATVLYKRGGFSADDLAKLHAHTHAMSFDELTYPGFAFDASKSADTLKAYREGIFGAESRESKIENRESGKPVQPGASPANASAADPTAPVADPSAPAADPTAPAADPAGDGAAMADPTAPADGTDPNGPAPAQVPATTMGQIAWNALLHGDWQQVANDYVFDTRALTNNRPYFAAYVKTADLTRVTDRLELFQDEWGYLLLWATLGIAALAALLLVAIPVLVGWRTARMPSNKPVAHSATPAPLRSGGGQEVRAGFSHVPGKLRIILYFACLGLGYIMVEVALIAKFVLPLGNPTVSASILITGMLVFSGLGSLTSERFMERAKVVMPGIFVAIGLLLIAYGFLIDPILNAIGTLPYAWRLVCCFLLIAPPAFLMGFPMSTAMTWLGRLDKNAMFLWAWGINGSFSVIGAALVPIIATSFGLAAVLQISGLAYLVAAPAFFAIFLPMKGTNRDRPA